MQYTCAGTGNYTQRKEMTSPDKPLRFIQIWIRPNAAGLPPYYHSTHFKQSDRLNKVQQIRLRSLNRKWFQNQSGYEYFRFPKSRRAGRSEWIALPGRQGYLACLEGALDVMSLHLKNGDALKIWDEPGIKLSALEDVSSHNG